MTMALLLSFIIGIAIIAMVMGFVLLGSQDKAQQIARRLEGSAPVPESYEAAASAELMRDEGLSTLPWLNRALGNWSRIEYVRTLLAQAGMETKPGQILLTTGVVVLATYLVAHLFLGDLLFPVLYALALGCVPIGTVYYRRHKRM